MSSTPPTYVEAVGQSAAGTIIVTTAPPLGPGSTRMVCPSCHAEITTSIKTEPGLVAWLSGGILALVGCWPCCLIPCCMPECMDTDHSCPNCRAYLGRYRK